MALFTDQIGRTILLDKTPQRIVSLVPSQTELLFDLGLNEQVVGITKFCVHPNEWLRSKTRVGGTKDIKVDIIDQLQPDLIIANKEENVKEQIDTLANTYPVWVSDVNKLSDAIEMIVAISEITATKNEGREIINQIESGFSDIRNIPSQTGKTPTILYLIWRNPYMAAGGDTFINDMLDRCGLINAIMDLSRYPELDRTALQIIKPDFVLLSSEPYPFKEKHVQEIQEILPGSKMILVDGELFSWYGSRLTKAPRYFKELMKKIK